MRKKEWVNKCSGAYVFDCYCKWESNEHGYNEFPHQFVESNRSKARKSARKRGWVLHRDGTGTCPKCS